jgi:hypothetical protein
MFRFSIREILMVTLVVAMGLAWWIDRSALATRACKGEQWEQRAKGMAWFLDDNNCNVEWEESGTTIHGRIKQPTGISVRISN